MTEMSSLSLERLHAAGLTDVVSVEPVTGWPRAGPARRGDGTSVFVKAFSEAPSDDALDAEAEGLAAFADVGRHGDPQTWSSPRLTCSCSRCCTRGHATRRSGNVSRTTVPTPEAHGFLDLYAELTGLDSGWRERMPILQLRQHWRCSPNTSTTGVRRAWYARPSPRSGAGREPSYGSGTFFLVGMISSY